jgi:hypothetical protein
MTKSDACWPDSIQTSLAPGIKLVRCGEPLEVKGKLWLSYIPEDDEREDNIIVERCEDGRLLRMRG